MNNRKAIKILLVLFAVVFCFGSVGLAEPLGTEFTYQGRLIDSNQAADGLYDFQFKLFDAASDGNQFGADVNRSEVDVIDGYFTVELDFGEAFDGNERWLDIGVRPGDQSDPCEYALLSPRQNVTPTPYALYALSGGSAGASPWQISDSNIYYNDGKVGIGMTSPGAYLQVSPAGGTTGDEVLWVASPADTAYVSNDVAIIQAGPASSYTGTVLKVQSRGTNNSDYALLDVRNGVASTPSSKLCVRGDGNVGIGTTSPDDFLEIEGSLGGKGLHLDSSSGVSIKLDRGANNNHSKLMFQTDGVEQWSIGHKGEGSETLGFYPYGGGTPSVVFQQNGNVGIGTTGPSAKLDVAGQVKITGGSPGTGKVLTSDVNGLASWQTLPAGGDDDWAWSRGSGLTGDIYHTGHAGIGGAPFWFAGSPPLIPSFGPDLHVHSGTDFIDVWLGDANSTNDANLARLSFVGYTTGPVVPPETVYSAIMGKIIDNGGTSADSKGALIFQTISPLVYPSGGGLQEKMRIGPYGDVGIGTPNPTSKLDVAGDINISTVYKIKGKTVLATSSTNTFVGMEAGKSCTTGTLNTFVGYDAGFNNVSGRSNTFVGRMAGVNSEANDNTIVGDEAGEGLQTGSSNTFLGKSAGWNNNGNGNVFVGYEAGVSETGSNKLCIANSDANILIYGDFSTGVVEIPGNLNQTGNNRAHNGVYEYAYSQSGTLDPNGDVTVQVPNSLFLGNDNIVFTYEAWVSIDYASSYPHDYRGAGYIRGQAWKERGSGVSGYSEERSYYRGTVASITPSTYSTNKTQFAISTTVNSLPYKFTVRGTSGGH